MKKAEISVILPCAGDGSRLGLSYPKELFEIFPGVKLIDFSLDHIKFFTERSDIPLQVLVTLKKGKEKVLRYVKEKLPDLMVRGIAFNSDFREWPGSVYSANEHFAEFNIVLLPDSFVSMSSEDRFSDDEGEGVIYRALKVMETQQVVFGVKPCSDSNVLKDLGAVRTVEDRIELLIDKPDDNRYELNGFWCIYGFKKNSGYELYRFLIETVEKRDSNIKNFSFNPTGFFTVYDYYDLGTMDSVEKFRTLFLKEFPLLK